MALINIKGLNLPWKQSKIFNVLKNQKADIKKQHEHILKNKTLGMVYVASVTEGKKVQQSTQQISELMSQKNWKSQMEDTLCWGLYSLVVKVIQLYHFLL